MSTEIKVSSLIFDDLTFTVPSTVEEYNALDPKRVAAGGNPVVEDAVDNIMKHKVLGGFRSDFLDALEEKYKIARINKGTEKEPRWEADAVYMNRVIATLNEQRNSSGTPLTDAFKKEIVAELRDLAQTTLSAQKFTVAGREPGAGGTPVGKNDTKLATDAWNETGADGAKKIVKLAALLGRALGREVVVDLNDQDGSIKNVAIALRDKRKADNDAREAELKAALT